MKTILIKGNKRSDVGTSSAKSLREEGMVPCVLYGGNENVNFAVYREDFSNLVYTPNTYKVKLDIDGQSYQAILQDIQFHPVNDTIVHVDFLRVFDDKPVTISVPVKLVGNAAGVRAGGKLLQKIKKLKVKGFIKDMPDSIEVNIDHLELGKSIKVGEVKADKITILDSPANALVSVLATRASKEAAASK